MSVCNDARARKVSAMDRIDAMLDQEESCAQCYNYLARSACHEAVDEESRASMIGWCAAVAKALKLDAETVWISTNYLDRYLSSGRGRSGETLQDKYQFQLASISCFYLAVKLHERTRLSAETLAQMCRNYYPAEDITEMEEDVIFALDWRVSTPTPGHFIREFVELLPVRLDAQPRDRLVAAALAHVDATTTDFYMSFYHPSAVGAACLSSALLREDVLTTAQRQAFWMQLGELTDLIDIMEVQNKLLEGKTLCKPVVVEANKENKKTTSSKKSTKAAASKPAKAAAVEKVISKGRSNSPKSVLSRRPSLVEQLGAAPVRVAQTARQA